MNYKICDVCYYEARDKKEEKRIISSRYRLRCKGKLGMRLALDVCERHKNFLRGCKTYYEAKEKVDNLLSNKIS